MMPRVQTVRKPDPSSNGYPFATLHRHAEPIRAVSEGLNLCNPLLTPGGITLQEAAAEWQLGASWKADSSRFKLRVEGFTCTRHRCQGAFSDRSRALFFLYLDYTICLGHIYRVFMLEMAFCSRGCGLLGGGAKLCWSGCSARVCSVWIVFLACAGSASPLGASLQVPCIRHEVWSKLSLFAQRLLFESGAV